VAIVSGILLATSPAAPGAATVEAAGNGALVSWRF
jgi:hypothetical protein